MDWRARQRLIGQRISLGFGQRFEFEIDIQIRPMKVMAVMKLDAQYLTDFRILEPGIVIEGQEVLAVCYQEPEAVGGNMADFSDRNAFARL